MLVTPGSERVKIFFFKKKFELQEQYLQVRQFNSDTIHDTVLTTMLLITLQYLQHYQLKGWGHNRLMSKFGPFFIFGQICLIFGMCATDRSENIILSFFSLVFSSF